MKKLQLLCQVLLILGTTVSAQIVFAYNISGRVRTETGVGVPGVLVTLSGTTIGATTATTKNGSYTFRNVDDGAYTIACNKADYFFKPVSRNVTVSGSDAIGQNFTGQATTQVKCLDYRHSTGEGGVIPVKFIRIAEKIYSLVYTGDDNLMHAIAEEKNNKMFISFLDVGWFGVESVYADFTHGEIDLATQQGTFRLIDFDAWSGGGENGEFQKGTIAIVPCP